MKFSIKDFFSKCNQSPRRKYLKPFINVSFNWALAKPWFTDRTLRFLFFNGKAETICLWTFQLTVLLLQRQFLLNKTMKTETSLLAQLKILCSFVYMHISPHFHSQLKGKNIICSFKGDVGTKNQNNLANIPEKLQNCYFRYFRYFRLFRYFEYTHVWARLSTPI